MAILNYDTTQSWDQTSSFAPTTAINQEVSPFEAEDKAVSLVQVLSTQLRGLENWFDLAKFAAAQTIIEVQKVVRYNSISYWYWQSVLIELTRLTFEDYERKILK